MFSGENCIEGNNRTNINIEQGVDYVTEVRTTLNEVCNTGGPNVPLQMGASTAGKYIQKQFMTNCKY